jgi:hypothetical protein
MNQDAKARALCKIFVVFLLAYFARSFVTKTRNTRLYACVFVPRYGQNRCAKFTTTILQNALPVDFAVELHVVELAFVFGFFHPVDRGLGVLI